MTTKEAIEQLRDLRKNQESFLDGKDPDPDNPFLKDTAAIDKALQILEDLEGLKTEIKNMKIELCNSGNETLFKMNYVTGYCSAMSAVEGLLDEINEK